MDKRYIVAGNRVEFDHYVKEKTAELLASGEIDFRITDMIYVSDSFVIAGVRNPHGVFVGSWRERSDILTILTHLIMRSQPPNTKLEQLKQDLMVYQKINGIMVSG